MIKKLLTGVLAMAVLMGTAYAALNLPDLTVNDVDLDSNSRLTFSLSNNGDDSVDPYSDGFVYVYVNDQVAWTYNWKYLKETGFLNAGETSVITSQIPKGSGDVRVCVDARSNVEELNEENNCFSREVADLAGLSVPTELPDLTIQDLYIDPMSKRLTIVQGNTGRGEVITHDGRTNIYVDGRLKWSYKWATLNDRSFLQPMTFTMLQPNKLNGSHEVTACISTEEVINEVSKRNNCFTKTVEGKRYVSKPIKPFRIPSVVKKNPSFNIPKPVANNHPDFSVERVFMNEDGMLSVEIANNGRRYTDQDGEIGIIELHLDGKKKVAYTFSELSDTAFVWQGGESILELLPLTGGHQVKVCIDPMDQIRETTDANNCLTEFVR